MQRLIGKFKNVELILPCENKDESLRIVNERICSRDGNGQQNAFDINRHFIESSCNYELATDVIYTQNMTQDEITNAILKQMSSKNMDQNGSIKM